MYNVIVAYEYTADKVIKCENEVEAIQEYLNLCNINGSEHVLIIKNGE